jgi:hypothetical protein
MERPIENTRPFFKDKKPVTTQAVNTCSSALRSVHTAFGFHPASYPVGTGNVKPMAL